MNLPNPTVLISYAHTGPISDEQVLNFANSLRTSGVEANLDQFEIHPPEGWPKWMEKQIRENKFIIIVLSDRWIDSFEQEMSGGAGALYEGVMISAKLSRNRVDYAQFCVGYFQDQADATKKIPDILYGCPRYNLSREDGLRNLYAYLTGQQVVQKAAVGKVLDLQEFQESFLAKRNFAASNIKGEFGNFAELRRELRPLVAENGRIFRDFGPNSGPAEMNEPSRIVRYDLRLWFNQRPKIAKNNAVIRDYIKANFEIIPENFKDLFERWISHIDAFEIHINNPDISYSDNQFPKEILSIFENISR